MKIANPIYDVVFKYLLDDNKIAKLLIGKIIGEEIIELEFTPTENKIHLSEARAKKIDVFFTVTRMDFAAKIKTDDGFKKVLIEIQKAKFPTDIMRFRKYLGSQYSSENNVIKTDDGNKALPIITIYFLGHKLDHADSPIIKVARKYFDISTGDELEEKEEFIESLTHDSFIIQIPELKGKRRNELELILSIFDQSDVLERHFKNIDEKDFPKEFNVIIKRLQKAILDEKLVRKMDLESEIIGELETKERKFRRALEESEKKDKIINIKDEQLTQKDSEIEKLKAELEKLKNKN